MPSRNVAILTLAYALSFSAGPLVVIVGGIAGVSLAPSPALTTAAIASFVVGLALTAIPGPLLMARIGRQRGFLWGAALGVGASLLGFAALEAGSFLGLCTATALLGAALAFSAQYRFAAAESVAPEAVSRAVSFVLLGGVAAGLLGPEIARRTRLWEGHADYSLSFLVMAAVYVAAAGLLLFMADIPGAGAGSVLAGRPLKVLVSQPRFLMATLAGTAAYGSMSFVMTATPVSMQVVDSLSAAATAMVIQSHIVAMFLPSLFTGSLIARFGTGNVMRVGALIMAVGLVIAASGHDVAHYWVSLVLIGMGWNFLFVGGTVLLTDVYRPEERFKVQAANDVVIFGVQAAASLTAGASLHAAGWSWSNLAMLPLLIVTLAALAIWRRHLIPANAA